MILVFKVNLIRIVTGCPNARQYQKEDLLTTSRLSGEWVWNSLHNLGHDLFRDLGLAAQRVDRQQRAAAKLD